MPATGISTRGGRLVRLQLPPVDLFGNHPDVKRLAVEHRRLSRELVDVRSHVRQLENQRREAEATDRARYAEALRNGKDDPGPLAVRDVDQRAAAARRRAEALDQALGDIEGELIGYIEEHRTDWLATINGEIEERRDRYAEAVEMLAAARDEMVTQRALRQWVENVPRRAVWTVGQGKLQRLTGGSGDAHAWSSVLAALRDDARREE